MWSRAISWTADVLNSIPRCPSKIIDFFWTADNSLNIIVYEIILPRNTTNCGGGNLFKFVFYLACRLRRILTKSWLCSERTSDEEYFITMMTVFIYVVFVRGKLFYRCSSMDHRFQEWFAWQTLFIGVIVFFPHSVV